MGDLCRIQNKENVWLHFIGPVDSCGKINVLISIYIGNVCVSISASARTHTHSYHSQWSGANKKLNGIAYAHNFIGRRICLFGALNQTIVSYCFATFRNVK